MPIRYKLSPDPVFFSLQGEGHLRGFFNTFIRLSGCSVGCPNCDTDYSKSDTKTAEEVADWADQVTPPEQRDRWAWITGGEPTDQDLKPLLIELMMKRFSTALATSGCRRFVPPVDWLSVSPHDLDTRQLYGNEVKLVDGLNGLDPWAWIDKFPDSKTDFMYRYVQPLSVGGKEEPESLSRCMEFLKSHPNWSLSRQDHHYWRVS